MPESYSIAAFEASMRIEHAISPTAFLRQGVGVATASRIPAAPALEAADAPVVRKELEEVEKLAVETTQMPR
jgi:hypothetical protein